MRTLDERELRSLVALLDDEDPKSLELVRREILSLGDRMIPFLEELKSRSGSELAIKAAAMTHALRFQNLRREFQILAGQAEPDLEKGCLLLARFAYPGIDTAVYSAWLDRVAARVQEDLPQGSDAATTFQKLNSHLFQAMGFSGNETHYYDPDNSYLNRIIETRRGIPVSLSALYLLLADRLRLPVYGVATPGHFLVGFRPGPHACFLDAYHRGRLMDLTQVRRMLLRSGYEFRPEFVARCSPSGILTRMIRNLISIYDKSGSPERSEMLSGLVEVLLRRAAAPQA